MAHLTVHKMFRAEKGKQNEKTPYLEIATAFLCADGKTIDLEFNGTATMAFRQDPKGKGGGGAAKMGSASGAALSPTPQRAFCCRAVSRPPGQLEHPSPPPPRRSGCGWRSTGGEPSTDRRQRPARPRTMRPTVLLPRKAGSAAAGALRPWPAVLVTWGPGGGSRLHVHHCWHLVVGLDADLRIKTSAGGRTRCAGALLTAPDVPHAVDAQGTRIVIVFVEPESDAGDRLMAAHGRGAVRLVRGDKAERLRALLSPEGADLQDATRVGQALSLSQQSVAPPVGRHPAVRRVLRHLRQAPPDVDGSLAGLAALAGLSTGRFMHAFTATVGIPLRPYLRWMRLERAGAALAAGATLGEAAHGAGFADAAHMTRTFRRMFGVTPSELRRPSQSVQDS